MRAGLKKPGLRVDLCLALHVDPGHVSLAERGEVLGLEEPSEEEIVLL